MPTPATEEYWAFVHLEAERTGRDIHTVRTDPAFKREWRFRIFRERSEELAARGQPDLRTRRLLESSQPRAVYTQRMYNIAANRVARQTGRTYAQVVRDEQFKRDWQSLRYIWQKESHVGRGGRRKRAEYFSREPGQHYSQVLTRLGIRQQRDTHRVGDTP